MAEAGQTQSESTKPPRRRGQHLTAKERRRLQGVFLAEFGRTAIITRGLEKAGINRSTLDGWLEHDAEFMVEYGAAKREADDVLRNEVYVRGVEGRIVTKQIKRRSANGRMVLDREETRREVSDNMLQLLVRSRLPEFRPDSTVRVELDQNMITLIIDVLTRNIADEATLEAIANDLAQLINAANT